METSSSENIRESCNSLKEYISTLETPGSCQTGQPGKLVWTPNENTPDTVYYQVHAVVIKVRFVIVKISFSLTVCNSFKPWLENQCHRQWYNPNCLLFQCSYHCFVMYNVYLLVYYEI